MFGVALRANLVAAPTGNENCAVSRIFTKSHTRQSNHGSIATPIARIFLRKSIVGTSSYCIFYSTINGVLFYFLPSSSSRFAILGNTRSTTSAGRITWSFMGTFSSKVTISSPCASFSARYTTSSSSFCYFGGSSPQVLGSSRSSGRVVIPGSNRLTTSAGRSI